MRTFCRLAKINMGVVTLKKICLLVLGIALLLTAACGGGGKPGADSQAESKGYEVTDVKGRKVKIPHKPKRIVTLSIYTDQIALGLVHTDRMAAVNKYLDDPKESTIVEKAKKVKTKVTHPTTEQMVAWRPDLVIATEWTAPEAIAAYSDFGIPVIVCNRGNGYEQVKDCVRLIAAAVDEKEKGEKILAKMEDELKKNKAKVDKIPTEKRKRVLLLSVMTDFGGAGSSFDDMCKHAGVINTMAEVGLKNGQILTKEMIIKCNPDIIFLPDYDNHGSFNLQQFLDSYLKDPAMQTVPAIKNKALYTPRDCYLYNCSQDFVYGVQEIDYFAYGDEFKLGDGMNISFSGE